MRFLQGLRPQGCRVVRPRLGLWAQPGVLRLRAGRGRLHQFCLPVHLRRLRHHEFHTHLTAGTTSPPTRRPPARLGCRSSGTSSPQDLLRGTSGGARRPGGPGGPETSSSSPSPGDGTFQHSPVVVATGTVPTLENTLIAAHSHDADNRPLSTLSVRDIRFLHITGTIRP